MHSSTGAPVTVEAIPFRGGMAVLDRATDCAFVYNETALVVWQLLGAKTPLALVEDAISRQFGLPPDAARRDLAAILEDWRSKNLLGSEPRQLPPNRCSDQLAGVASRRAVWSAQWHVRIGGHDFHLLVEDAKAADLIRNLYRHMEVSDAQAATRIEVRSTGPYEAAVLCDGRERVRSNLPGLIIGAIHQSILDRLHPDAAWLAHIHAGAVAWGDGAIILPAPSGSGKTTLIGYLISQGFRYLADDLAAISQAGLVPWPLPLSVKSGSWGVLTSHWPELMSAPSYATKGFEARLLQPPDCDFKSGPFRIACVAFPRYRVGASCDLRRLDVLETLRRLMGDRVWLGYPLTRQCLSRFLRFVENVPAYAIEYGNLSEAAEALRGLVPGPSGEAPRPATSLRIAPSFEA